MVAGAEPGSGDFEVTLSRGRGRHGAWDCFDSLFCPIIMFFFVNCVVLF